jgi:spoIIIJ-associated protein
VKDRVFAGRDVSAALAAASQALGLPESGLRYVVLDAGSEGGRGQKATPAQIAVLLEERRAPAPIADRGEVESPTEDPAATIRSLIRAIAETAQIDAEVEVEEGEQSVVVRVEGGDPDFWIGSGRGEVLHAVEHLLQRSVGTAYGERPIRLRSRQLQQRLDAALVEEARRLAAQVRADGAARETEPLNSYERRIVHVALGDEPGITTYSVGEGATKRVTVALAPAESPEAS